MSFPPRPDAASADDPFPQSHGNMNPSQLFGADLTLAFGIVLCLAAAAGVARALSPPGVRRNTLSVVLVVLSLIAAFLFCFGLGSFVRGREGQARLQSGLSLEHEPSANTAPSRQFQ
jgi:hypothetical protein